MAFIDLAEGILGIFAEVQWRADLASRQEQKLASIAKGFRLRVGRKQYKTRKDKGTTRTSPEHKRALRAAAQRRRLARIYADPMRRERFRQRAREAMARKRAGASGAAALARDRANYRAREQADPVRRERRLSIRRAANAARKAALT